MAGSYFIQKLWLYESDVASLGPNPARGSIHDINMYYMVIAALYKGA